MVKLVTIKGDDLNEGDYYRIVDIRMLDLMTIGEPSYKITKNFKENPNFIYLKGNKPHFYTQDEINKIICHEKNR